MGAKVRFLFRFVFLPVFIVSTGCSPSRYLGQDEFLLHKNKITLEPDSSTVGSGELKPYYQQKPNSKFLGIRTKVWLYQLFKTDKEKGLKQWLHSKLGEEPVVYSRYSANQTTSQFEKYLYNQGYLRARVEDTTHFDERKATVHYHVSTGPQYRITQINRLIRDTLVHSILRSQHPDVFVREGNPLNVDLLKKKRQRITKILQEEGFFQFSSQFISYVVDTTHATGQSPGVGLTLDIKNPMQRDTAGFQGHNRFRIDSLIIYTSYDPNLALRLGTEYKRNFRKSYPEDAERIKFMHHPDFEIHERTILRELYLMPDSVYRKSLDEKTYQKLLSLSAYQYGNIDFRASSRDTVGRWQYLDCIIQLTPVTQQAYSINAEGTSTSGNFGVAGNLEYKHQNLFDGSESFNLRLRGAREAQGDIVEEDNQTNVHFLNTYEYGIEGKLRLPVFLFPSIGDAFYRKYTPKTNIGLAYNFQERPDYTRTILNASFGYFWKSPGHMHTSHTFNPVEINMVQVPYKDDSFLENVTNPYIINSYKNQLIIAMNYNVLFDTKAEEQRTNRQYIRLGLESSGNVLEALSGFLPQDPDDNFHRVLGIQYSQYIKGDIDFRWYHNIDAQNRMAYRLFAGLIYPYGNAEGSSPFIKKYYAGGANSIRAWPVRALGPGSSQPSQTGVYNQLGDVRLEANMEYRFKMFWMFEGAVFADVGNIWELPGSTTDEQAAFYFDRFHKQLAVGSGLGLRMDLSFILIRFDFGLKLRNPTKPEGKRWLPGQAGYNFDQWTFNFGISYPF